MAGPDSQPPLPAMGSNKTPGRVTLKTMLGWSGEGGEVPGGEPSATAAATAAVLKKGGDATVDLGALMRTKKKAQLLGTSGGLTAHSSLALPGKWGPCALMQGAVPLCATAPCAPRHPSPPPTPAARAGSPALPAGVVAAANPVYSPDDSLAKAASKLQSLKALRASTAAPAAPRLQLGAAAAAPARGPPSPSPGPAAPAPQACESPRIGTAVAAEAQPAAPEAEGSQQRLGCVVHLLGARAGVSCCSPCMASRAGRLARNPPLLMIPHVPIPPALPPPHAAARTLESWLRCRPSRSGARAWRPPPPASSGKLRCRALDWH